MPKRTSKRKETDISLIAHRIIEQVIGEPLTPPQKEPAKPEKNPAAVALGRLGGKKGGPARAKKLSVKRRMEIAKKAAQKRWEGKKI